MKKKILIPIVILLMFGLGAYYLVSNSVNNANDYDMYVEKAREQAKVKTVYAMDYYYEAIKLKPSVDLYLEVADYLKELGNYDDVVEWCNIMIDNFQDDPRGYDYLMDVYMYLEDYESCFDLFEIRDRREVESEHLDEIYKEIYYYYEINSKAYTDANIYSRYFAPVYNGEYWGCVNRLGEQRLQFKYKHVGYANENSEIPVITKDDEAVFVNENGERLIASLDKFKYFGPLFNDVFTAQKANGKYSYYDRDFDQIIDMEFDYASSFNGDVAAVKVGNKWRLIDKEGKVLTADFDEIVLDEKEIAYRNDRAIAKKGDKYFLIDSNGNQIGGTYEDAKLFGTGGDYAAVKINGKWGFVDKDGNLVIDAKYTDVRTFSNGLAAVKFNGAWGFIDGEGNTAIDYIFEDARDFNDLGSCFVKSSDGYWVFLRLYRLNRS